MSKEYYVGLTFDEFQQGLLRIAIRHKSIFNKLAEKIAETASGRDMDQAMDKDADIKEKNEFQEPENIDVRGLMEERDIDKSFADHYGDISKGKSVIMQSMR